MKIEKLNENRENLIEKRKLQLKNANITRPMGWHSQLSPGGSSDSGMGESYLGPDMADIRNRYRVIDSFTGKVIDSFRDLKNAQSYSHKLNTSGNHTQVDDFYGGAVDSTDDSLDEAKKKQKRMINNGDPEYNRQMFNHMMGSGDMPKPPKGSDKLVGGSSADGTIGTVSSSGASGIGTGASGGMGESLRQSALRRGTVK